METFQKITFRIDHLQEGSFLTVPFQIPEGQPVEVIDIRYDYTRFDSLSTRTDSGSFTGHPEINIIDLGLIDPNGFQVGASGSDKSKISISEIEATPGYLPSRLIPGEWHVLLGAYKVEAQGVEVNIEIHFTLKVPLWIKGDLHTHTLASDGVLTAEELGRHAVRHGLDFVAITDHNQMISAEALPHILGLTFIQGIEWTHYKGHASFLGVDHPYDGTFAANTFEDIQSRFESAREQGALITINHPFEDCCVFQLDYNRLPFDCLEIWNGSMRESNLKAVELWHSLLVAGKKVPACGGSDYHRDKLFQFLGGPTTCVYAMSRSAADILCALRQGNAYIVFAPDGPRLEMTAGAGAIMGDSVSWREVKQMTIQLAGLKASDVVRVVTDRGSDILVHAPAPGDFSTIYTMQQPGFARVEVLRAFVPGLPMLPAVISNPIYFDD